jgi:anaerobilin synthase
MRVIPFESFTYPFFDFNYKADHRAVVAAFYQQPDPESRGLNGLYVHVPFCETLCLFCPFNKSVGTAERVERYVSAIVREAELVGRTARCQSMTFHAVYIGGGTPSVLTIDQIERVFDALRRNFNIATDAEISFEFEPKSVTLDMLHSVKAMGTTRVSFGVQTFDPQMRGSVNLTATPEHLENATRWATDVFDRTNFDLMVGFPGQTEESVLRDVELAAASGISSVSIYPVDYVMTAPILVERIGRGELPPPAPALERHRLFHRARHELRKHFEEHNIYCYGRPAVRPCRYMFEILYGGYREQYIGLGVGAYSLIKGLMSQNLPDERQYVQALQDGLVPVNVSSPYHAYEKGLVFFPKRTKYDSRELEELGLSEVYEDRIRHAVESGLIQRDGTMLSLTEAGQDDYAAMMTDFFSDHQRRLYQRICRKLSSQVGWMETAQTLNVPLTRPAKKWGAITSMKSIGSVDVSA